MSDNAERPQEPQPSVQPWIGGALRMLRTTDASLQSIGRVVGAALQALPTILPGLLQGIERVNAFPDAVQEGSVALAKLGWFYDLQFPAAIFWDIRDWVREGRTAEIDTYFVEHYERSADDIQAQLLSTYAARSELLGQAFSAASQTLYFAAIPVLLAQADGLSVDIMGGKLFKSVNRRPQAASSLDQMQLEKFTLKFLAALQHNGGFNAAEEYRHEFPSAPNRHDIMHGRDLSYGTRMNYLKTLSLLAFIGLHVPDILRDGQVKESPG
ncbi:hypothetical protein [Paucibacter sp. M5-1]|uniref:hypothetical protein n=1 Tax=Paucibacter sp. M5-1 TaxID=3015998 RepID=UPI0010F87517|nr:hypothetical protein [Paucibacter sp. M5-1]MCZ7883106.1 hypothetical protein [Paucibacter sp. M5-1]